MVSSLTRKHDDDLDRKRDRSNSTAHLGERKTQRGRTFPSVIQPPRREVSKVAFFNVHTRANRTNKHGNGNHRPTNVIHPICTLPSEVQGSALHGSNAQIVASSFSKDETSVSDKSHASLSYVVKVRIMHALDLVNPCATNRPFCSHHFFPSACVSVNNTNEQWCHAAQHTRNYTMWKKASLYFPVSPSQSSLPTDNNANNHHSGQFFSLRVRVVSMCTRGSGEKAYQLNIGDIGELKMAFGSHDYEVARFFPLFQHRHPDERSVIAPCLVGKLKLRVRFEVVKQPVVALTAAMVTTSSTNLESIPRSRPFFSINLGEALQAKRKQLKATVAPEKMSGVDSTSKVFDADASASIMKELELETGSQQFQSDQIQIVRGIGEGIHSRVYYARLTLKNVDESSVDVAVKEFRYQNPMCPPPTVLETFRQEVRLLAALTSQDPDYIVKYLGVVLQPRVAILTEYFNDGSLAQCMKNQQLWDQISTKQKAAIGLQIAQGIAWLHQQHVIHRDIKSHNILLKNVHNGSLIAKICDIGSAIIHLHHESLLTEEVGSSGYTAPEVFTQQGYDSKIDVWSFGIVLWELTAPSQDHRVNPFTGLRSEEFVDIAQQGHRPDFSTNQHLFQEIVQRCWMFDPHQRPTMDAIVRDLQILLNSL